MGKFVKEDNETVFQFPEVDDDDLPLPEFRVYDDEGNIKPPIENNSTGDKKKSSSRKRGRSEEPTADEENDSPAKKKARASSSRATSSSGCCVTNAVLGFLKNLFSPPAKEVREDDLPLPEHRVGSPKTVDELFPPQRKSGPGAAAHRHVEERLAAVDGESPAPRPPTAAEDGIVVIGTALSPARRLLRRPRPEEHQGTRQQQQPCAVCVTSKVHGEEGCKLQEVGFQVALRRANLRRSVSARSCQPKASLGPRFKRKTNG